jgi:hypothetical protein
MMSLLAESKLCQDLRYRDEVTRVLYNPSRKILESYGLPGSQSPDWYNYFAIFDLPYFECVWIIQEVAVSSRVEVLCGSASQSWDDLSDSRDICSDLGLEHYHSIAGLVRSGLVLSENLG